VLNLLRAWPPRLTSAFILVGGSLHLVLRWLSGTLTGTLLVSFILYQWCWAFSDSRPMTGQQIAVWLSEIPFESRVSIGSAIITVVGFLIAFRTATANWREQTLSNLRVGAAEEIQQFFEEVSGLVLSMKLYAQDVASLAATVQKAGLSQTESWKARAIYEDLPKFLDQRARLSILSVDVYRLAGKHYALLAPFPGALATLHDCEKAVDAVSKAMWVGAPRFDPECQGPERLFLSAVDPVSWDALAEVSDQVYDRLGVLTSGVRSVLFKGLHAVSLSMLVEMARNLSMMETALGMLRPSKGRGKTFKARER